MAWISPRQPTRIVFEAAGADHRAFEMVLGQATLPAVKVNPGKPGASPRPPPSNPIRR